MMGMLNLLSLAVATTTPVNASATTFDYTVTGAHVRLVEGTYLPGLVKFQIDVAAGSCPAGSYLAWNSKGADETAQASNGAAALSVLLTAKATNTTITFGGFNSGCAIDYLQAQ
jgi:hypothetical protein